MQTLKLLWSLLASMFKIGLFTFGGGYAMISLLEREFVEKKNWLSHDEFMDLVVIAESTPGPIAINCATYIGYKVGKGSGAVAATLGMVMPSLGIIFLISLFFEQFLAILEQRDKIERDALIFERCWVTKCRTNEFAVIFSCPFTIS